MRASRLIIAIACSATLSTGIGFAAAELSDPEPVRAAKADPSVKLLKQINGELKTLNEETTSVSDAIGSKFSLAVNGTVVSYLHDIERHTSGTCEAVGGGSDCTTIYSDRR